MVIAISNWSSPDFSWLEHDVCQGQCSQTDTWSTLSNLKFYTTNVVPIDPPEPDEIVYAYGDDCTNLTDQDCQLVANCTKCSWSWPQDDPDSWWSSDALCRCQTEGDSTPSPSPDPSPQPDPTPSGQFPALTVKVDGVDTTLYVQYPEYWSEADVYGGNEIGFDYNNRMYLSTESSINPNAYFKPNLLGGSIEFDVDLSNSKCGCLTALYMIVMPDSANSGDPFQYCDAAYVGGYGCPEFDVMEANLYAWRTTAHKCSGSKGSYSDCHGDGYCTTDVILE